MSIVEDSVSPAMPPRHEPVVCGPARSAFHRIATVRREQGVTLRTVSRNLGTDVRTLREQENERTDLRLSELYAWQEVLEVPVGDLLVDPGTALSRPVHERAQLVRLMKTAMALHERAASPGQQRMTQMLIDQLIAIMPELAEVSAWHTVGQRRGLDEYGRVMERRMSDEVFQRLVVD